jgi:hypothetical protein
MLRKKGHPSLCIFHAREEQQLLEADKPGAPDVWVFLFAFSPTEFATQF